ncbi:DNA-binding winged helix-turn-helix (wHTH) protein/predicted ATPase [Caulobacter ginsengisoli]|uniref:DNA-binding winged helix-turn-helix (WHTH) protein/predicted ATPase n=1 Tax=Caulobacter ginsengisoli TaxID=400775 RepID=A0ABU0IZK2_9CAUL|nr:AAA family ATPase [Caulobacter ginsengisoli]MDQ0466726.1 DNA-binding winged helix-turn-helix (wHTH) protein/predicted ATPase [Caulobacter ginsengisoli]
MPDQALGSFHLDEQGDLLFRGDEPVALGRRAVALLRALVERPGAPVSKDALIEAAWPGQTVEDSNLTVQIAALRKALGEVPGGERWIETMPRRGYRYVGPVAATPPETPVDAPPPMAERRQITAMSCELVGRPEAVDDLEDLREAHAAFQRCVTQMADRYGGHVLGQLGATALVLFGYPAAGEHDAEQAVRAGIGLRAAVGALKPDAPMRCRAGIATGVAIIGDREIVGDAPDLAVQLRLSAQPGNVAIEPATRGLIGDLFDCRDFGSIASAGRAGPLRVWQVLGEGRVASRFEALRGAVASRLVGRDEEIDLLLRRWARAAAGEGQVVLMSGEPGLGKSRLAAEMADRLQGQPHRRLGYFCSPHHQDSALFPFVDQLERACGFTPDDLAPARRERLAALLAEAALPDEDVALLSDLLALPAPDPPPLANQNARRTMERTLEALLRQIEGLARRQPVVMIFEDAHWIDATSRDLLDLAVERVRGLPVLLIVTFRPEFKPPWTGQPHVTALALSRLDRRERISLVAQVAGKALPAAVLDQIADRTDGVPLFVEELTKSVLESGLLRAETDRFVLDGTAPAFAIPTSLYALLLARLDRPASMRRVAQAGAAIGREFSYGLLRAVCRLPEDQLQSALAQLVASELAFQRGMPPESVYSFKHALVQDVAYGSLVRADRQQLHAAIVQALETRSPELIETQPELLAHHCAEAGLAQKSAEAWGRAGWRSAARSALAEAAAQFQKALDQLALTPESLERARQELEFRSALAALLRFIQGQAAPETGRAYARTQELWEQLGSPPEFRHVPYGQSMYHVYRGELDLARRVGEDLLRLSGERGDSAGLVMGHSVAGQSLLLAGNFAGSRMHLEALQALYDPLAHATLVQQAGSHPLMTQAFLGLGLFCLGFPDQANARSLAAIAEARRLAHPTSLAVGLAIGALQASLAEDGEALDLRASELAVVASEQGLPFYQAWAAIYQGRAKVQAGDVAGGIALLQGGLAAYRATGAVMWLPHFIALLAAGHEAAGEVEDAAVLLDEAMQIVARTGERWFAAELYRRKGQLLLRLGQAEAAAEQYRQAIDLAGSQGARLWELRAAVSLARLYCDRGDHAEAGELLGPVYGGLTEGFGAPDLAQARALLDGIGATARPTA